MTIQLVQTKAGSLSCSSQSNEVVAAYLGVAYALPPIGELRWKSPQPLIDWEGIKPCENYGASAPQKSKTEGEFYAKEFPHSIDNKFDEDCLYLNVFTPAKSNQDKLAVFVNIHGGGFSSGSGRDIQFDGFGLSSKGIILVNINYRLDVLGFLSHPWMKEEEACGCFGIADQITALNWVHDNIEAFGGDPDNITLMGQSAGAMSTQMILTSPSASGLIKQAIMQSGGGILPGMKMPHVQEGMKIGEMLTQHLKVKNLAELKAISVETLRASVAQLKQETKQSMLFAPCFGNQIMPLEVSEALIQGKFEDVPILIGANQEEFPGMPSMAVLFQSGGRNLGKLLLEQDKTKPYLYFFQRAMPGDQAGAFHSAELWYVFGSLKHCWRPLTKADYALSNQMMDAWIHFAQSGKVGVDGWMEYDGTMESEYVFDIE